MSEYTPNNTTTAVPFVYDASIASTTTTVASCGQSSNNYTVVYPHTGYYPYYPYPYPTTWMTWPPARAELSDAEVDRIADALADRLEKRAARRGKR